MRSNKLVASLGVKEPDLSFSLIRDLISSRGLMLVVEGFGAESSLWFLISGDAVKNEESFDFEADVAVGEAFGTIRASEA